MFGNIIDKTIKFIYLSNSHINFVFFKKILIAVNFNWFKFNKYKVTLYALSKGYQPIFIKQKKVGNRISQSFKLNNKNKLNPCYKGIDLLEVTKYQICVELQIFINDLDFNNPSHIPVIQKWFQKAISYINYVYSLFKKYHFTKAIILQGHLYDQAIIRWICIEKGIEVVAVENTFNSTKIIWDNISGLSVNKNLTRNYYWRYSSIVDKNESRNYAKKYIKNIKKLKQDEQKSPHKKISNQGEGKAILFIGQVYTDASTFFGINAFHSPLEIIKNLTDYSKKNNYNLIIKLHPKEIDGLDTCLNKYNSLTHRKILEDSRLYTEIQKNNRIIYDYENKFDTYSLIRASDICVTINSQAGLESLLLGKRVITCGNAFYDILSPVYTAKNNRMLLVLLDYLMAKEQNEIDMYEIYKFIYIFNEKYCINKDEKMFVSLFGKII